LSHIIAIIAMITITWIKAIVIQNMKTKKNHQIYKYSLVEDRIRLLRQFNFSLMLNTTFIWTTYFMKILQYCPGNSPLSSSPSTPPPKPGFGSNYERIGGRDRIYGH
jgi:hypothetical protein